MSEYKPSRYASQTPYIPSDPSNWAVPPVDVKDALDKLAASAAVLAWQDPVEDKDVTDPSTLTPSVGERWIVAVGGVGLWAGKDNDIAEWDGVQWDFITPTEGFACEILDEDQYYAFTGTAWVTLPDFLRVVSGPASATDHAISRYDGTTGLKIQDSSKNTIDDTGKEKISGDVTNTDAEIEMLGYGTGGLANAVYGHSSGVGVGSIGHLGGQIFSIQALADLRIYSGSETGSTNSKKLELMTGSTVDGDSADIDQTIGTPSGTGTRGDINQSAKQINLNAGRKIKVTQIADSNYSALVSDWLIEYVSLTATRTITLPNTFGNTGTELCIKDGTGSASPTVKITIDGLSTQTIDGVEELDITVPFGFVIIYSDGVNWKTRRPGIRATETIIGSAELATQTETDTGTDDYKIVTPLKLAGIVGTTLQAYDATLQSISALGTGADSIAYTTAIDTWAEATLTAFARTLLDDADAATTRTTLGLGSADTPQFAGLGLGGAPGASAIFQADSTTKGLLPPRMTTTQRNAIGSPAAGLLVYNTTGTAYNFYNGTVWRQIVNTPVASLEVGGVPFATETCCIETDAANLFWNNTNKRLGIGKATPNATLDVTGNSPGEVGGFPAGVLQITSLTDLENANAVITGHNPFGGNKQLWYLGSSSTINDNITLRNRQNGSLTLATNDLDRVAIQADGKIGMGLTPTANMAGLSIEAGLLTIKETATPTADADYGKVYCKNDNKIYFQDGAGVEHEIALV